MAVVDVLNSKAEKVSQTELTDEIFRMPIQSNILHEVVTMQLANRRAGSAAVKHRSDVRGSGRKLFRQKGTGRARRGDIKSPLLRGGGSVFGPDPRSYAYKVPKKVKRLALKMALSSKLKEEKETSTAGKAEKALSILLVEDAEEIRFLIEAYLKKTHHTLDMAENGKEGLNKFIAGKYDLVFMDIQMPVMDGLTAVSKLRRWEKENNRPTTPVIALTAHTYKEQIEKCIKIGCTAHVSKPVKKKELLDAIGEVAYVSHRSMS